MSIRNDQTPDFELNGTVLRTFDDRRVVLLRGARELYVYGDNAPSRVRGLLRQMSFNAMYTRARRTDQRNVSMLRLPQAA